jgi:hypothetical protein
MDLAGMKAIEITKLPGVADLPAKARSAFSIALKSEAEGNHEKAAMYLDMAIKAEDDAKGSA